MLRVARYPHSQAIKTEEWLYLVDKTELSSTVLPPDFQLCNILTIQSSSFQIQIAAILRYLEPTVICQTKTIGRLMFCEMLRLFLFYFFIHVLTLLWSWTVNRGCWTLPPTKVLRAECWDVKYQKQRSGRSLRVSGTTWANSDDFELNRRRRNRHHGIHICIPMRTAQSGRGFDYLRFSMEPVLKRSPSVVGFHK